MMPLYDYRCPNCDLQIEVNVPMSERDGIVCPRCKSVLHRLLAAPLGRIAGRALKGGGPDRFTADVLGISDLRDLPSGLRTPAQPG